MLVDSNNTNKFAGSFKTYIITIRSKNNLAKIFKCLWFLLLPIYPVTTEKGSISQKRSTVFPKTGFLRYFVEATQILNMLVHSSNLYLWKILATRELASQQCCKLYEITSLALVFWLAHNAAPFENKLWKHRLLEVLQEAVALGKQKNLIFPSLNDKIQPIMLICLL